MSTSNRIDRESLYEQVWEIPMIELAKQFGVSRPTIKWACQQLRVPLPPQAYWIHRKRGHLLPRPDLPSSSDGETQVITVADLIEHEAPSRRRKQNRRRWRQDTEHARRAIDEQIKYEELLSEVESWNRAESIRRYLAELDRQKRTGPAPLSEYEDWRKWAQGIAAELDPIERRLRRGVR
ncbi:hypothetical protein [Burkholderia lata]|uniref:hypothetical protein n=1 Tax=Burkholderia lata (strain ATCC 17760 / DSM 23089 / LMG 22485 / NCIMB 9086 / R18194 / 383) TaxID=482957 RepID=UPI001581C0B0|nr:hypothetical protein [Burkholderia lata]